MLPASFGEPSFASFRAELAEVLRRRVFAELSRFVVAQGFFWDGDFDNEFQDVVPMRRPAAAAMDEAAPAAVPRRKAVGARDFGDGLD